MIINSYSFGEVADTWTANNSTISPYNTTLKAYWALEDLTDSKGSNDLTNNNTATFTSGKRNNAFTGDGVNQYLSITDTSDLSPTTDMGLSAWIYLDSLSATQGVYSKDNSFYLYRLNSASDILAGVYQSNGTSKDITGSGITTGSWHHIVHIADSTAGKCYFYLNDTEIGNIAYDGTIRDSSDSFTLGRNLIRYWTGQIDEFAFWKNPTFANDTAREAFVTALYNSATGSFYTG